ncbi:hypothetical protein VE04_00876 [Pseudogymnoascus sp. 24MN13]|nr:hypothetical protein VE04_00876 [Pseudogymnoascus sp. 24MN13]
MRGSLVPRSKALGALLDNVITRQAPATQHAQGPLRQTSPIYKAALRQLTTASLPKARLPVTQPKPNTANLKLVSSWTTIKPTWPSPATQLRALSTTPQRKEVRKTEPEPTPPKKEDWKEQARREEEEEEDLEAERGFGRSEKASRAAQVNLSARLGDTKGVKNTAGFGEIWRLIKIARPEARWLGLAFVFLLISSTITMSIPFSIGKILDLATNESGEGKLFGLDLKQFYIALGCVLTIGAAANYGRIIILRIVGERIVSRLRSQLYRRTYVQNAEFFDANRVGDLISRLSSDTVIVGKSITQNLSDGLRAFVSGGAGFAAMAWVSIKLTSILCLMFPPVAIGAFFYGRMIRNLSRKIQRNLGTLTKIAEERLGNVRTSQAFAGEIQEVSRYNKQIKKIFALGKKEAIISATFFSSTGFMGNMTILALLYSGGAMVKSGAISIGDLTSFLMYTAYAGSSLFGLSSFYSELMKGVGAASRLFELQDRKPTIHATVGQPVKSAQGPITFKDVHFAYPTRPAVDIFSGLDFTIPSGSNVVLVGPSGCGKSTSLPPPTLLQPHLRPSLHQRHRHLDDERQIPRPPRRHGRPRTRPHVRSVAENVYLGRPNASRSEIIAAARKANCQFIEDFPEGLDTQVGARGDHLGGGQKQRLSIALALVKDPDLLILDEATSALDAESEALVNSALAALLRGHNTTISIAHRLSTIKRSDRIIVLVYNGKVAEMGTYKELAADPESAFSRLMEWQMSGGEGTEETVGVNRGHVTEKEVIADDLAREAISNEEEEAEQEKAELGGGVDGEVKK